MLISRAAIDVWAAGMILLFFLSGKFPLMQSNDDMEALMEIAAVIGRKRMEKAATLHSQLSICAHNCCQNIHLLPRSNFCNQYTFGDTGRNDMAVLR